MLEKLKKILKNADNPSEDSSEYDGAFSYSSETHAFMIGFQSGFIDLKPDGMDKKEKKNPDVQKEPAYAKAGYALGALVRNGIVAGGSVFVFAN